MKKSNGDRVNYFDRDFDWDEYVCSLTAQRLVLPEIGDLLETAMTSSGANESEPQIDGNEHSAHSKSKRKSKQKVDIKPSAQTEDSQTQKWDSFFSHHTAGAMYKPRRYIRNEFGCYFDELLSHDRPVTVFVEVGCGYGCTMFPLLEAYCRPSATVQATATVAAMGAPVGERVIQYIATDYAQTALDILQRNPLTNTFSDAIETSLWDVTQPCPSSSWNLRASVDAILAIFALSAVHPRDHVAAMEHLRDLFLSSTAIDASVSERYLLFRDYGLYDMTMFRHTHRCDTHTFQRQDGTLCHYFSKEYMRELAEKVGFRVVELEYATVINRNRKTGQELHRVFLHAVLAL